MKTSLSFVTTSLLGVFVFAGCYTLLKHPRLEVEPATVHLHENSANHVASSDDCLRCHAQADDYYNETLPYSNYYDGRSRNWLYFYDSPWWAEPYYYGGAVAKDAEELPSPRTFGRRHSNPQGAPMGAQPAVAPTGSGATPVVAKRAQNDGNSESNTVESTHQQGGRRGTPQADEPKQERRIRKSKDDGNSGSKSSTVTSAQQRNERRPTSQADQSKQKRRVRKKKDND